MTAIVTGGAGEIGRATGEASIRDGWSVLLVDRSPDVHAFAEEIGASGCEADITAEHGRSAIAAACPAPSALINVAGLGRIVPLMDTSEELWRNILEVNVTSAFLLSQQVARQMADTGGVIVNVTSISGIRASGGRVAYGTSKAALIHMTYQFALELAPIGIRCNAVAPGPVDTPMAREHPSAQMADYLKTIPQGRYAQSCEVADAIGFLCSDKARHITGQCLAVDGGWLHAGVGVG